MSVLVLTACSSGIDQRYLDATSGEYLQLPPDLTEYGVESKFELPAIFSGDDKNARNKLPVLARVDSMQLRGSNNFYWLEVAEPVDNIYQLVKNFWLSEGYPLALDEPVIGVMQTEWAFREVGSKQKAESWVERLFSSEDLSASQDQFKTRIERDAENNLSRIYISHRATEYIHVIETGESASIKGGSNRWGFRQPEPELEVEMLSRLMIYLGLQQAAVQQQLENVKLFSPRAVKQFDAKENSPYLLLKDPYSIAWHRVYHQLERLNIEINNANFKDSLFNEGSIMVNADISEDNKGGGLSALFVSKKTDKKQMVLVVSEQDHTTTKLSLETSEGDLDTSQAGAGFLDLLYQQLR